VRLKPLATVSAVFDYNRRTFMAATGKPPDQREVGVTWLLDQLGAVPIVAAVVSARSASVVV
jgi:hypothetical protein